MKYNFAKPIYLLLVALLLIAMAMPALAESPKGAYVVDTLEGRDRLNVHGTPSIDDVIDHLENGTVVQYLSSDKGWWYVKWWKGNDNFGEGYVDGDYLVPVDVQPARFTCVDNLYVHSQPQIAKGECWAYHTGKLTKGTKVEVLEQKGTWSRIEGGEINGWVASVYLVEAK